VTHSSVSEGDVLAGYRPVAGAFDELIGADGRVRSHWQPFLAALSAMPGSARQNAADTAARMLRENNVTYVSPGNGDGARPWQLDLFPLLIAADEWAALESGLVQRAELLNAIVADLYGSQQLIKSAGFPTAMLFGNPEFLVPCHGIEARDGIHLHLLAFDLGRAPDGRWFVLSNRTQAPAGAGYALENRIITSRSFPDAFAQSRVRRLAAFFRGYSEYLLSLGNRDEHLAVVLSPGPGIESYFEHAFLGRYLGYPVVEGVDLTVRASRLFLKTLEGLRPVDLLLRRIDSRDCDPLELEVNSDIGVAGLVEAARAGEVVVANALGSGVVENEAIMAFLPGLCRQMLGQELMLPSIDTWWCGDEQARVEVMGRLNELVVRRAFGARSLISAGATGFLSSEFEGMSRDAVAKLIDSRPYDYVAQRRVMLSRAPTFDADGSVRPEPMMLRVFVAATKDGFRVMPGGLALSTTVDGDPTVRGDSSKDVWVIAEGSIDTFSMLGLSLNAPVLKRSDRDLPSRTGDDLFWLGRYLERAEGAVRLFRSLMTRLSGEGGVAVAEIALEHLTALLVSQERLSARRARRATASGVKAVEQELANVLFDPESPDGLARVLANVRRTAEGVRERLSADTWRILEQLTEVPTQRWRAYGVANATRQLNDMTEHLLAVSGMIQENMTRGYGWRLLDLGRRIERARYFARLIRDIAVTGSPEEGGLLHLLLELGDSAMTYRSRYRATPQLPAVLDLLLTDDTNPRSLAFQFEEMEQHLAMMPQESQGGPATASQRIVIAVRTELRLAEVEKLANVKTKAGRRSHLARLLDRVEEGANELSEIISLTYFSHAHERRVGGSGNNEVSSS